MKRFLAALFVGTVFGLGLAIGGMTNPQKVLAFLDVAGDWDPSLILLMAVSIVVTFILFMIAHRMSKPLLGKKMHWPSMTRIDVHVIVGPILFGIGWGIGGVCPGPGIQLVVTNAHAALWFVPPMLIGFWIGRPYHRRARKQAEQEKAKS
jgi:uncharacterized protein